MTENHMHVTVVNFNMPFWSMVGLMIKWAFATIPAVIVVYGLIFFFGALVAAFFASLGGL